MVAPHSGYQAQGDGRINVFSSCDIEQLHISEETYRPNHDGYDLGFDVSASDMIRTIWAHLIGLLEVSAEFGLNHPGLLVFDEPKQQGAAEVSFVALLDRASVARSRNQQVIFATSEDRAGIVSEMKSRADHVIEFEGKILTPLPE